MDMGAVWEMHHSDGVLGPDWQSIHYALRTYLAA